jgi:hypothetical protein
MSTTSQDRIPELRVRPGVSKAVVWSGVALGTTLAILAMMHGARLHLGGMPALPGAVFGVLVEWALFVATAILAAEMTRRHHKTAARYAAQQGSRGASAGGQALRRHALMFLDKSADWAAPRWHARTGSTRTPDEITQPIPSAAPASPSADSAEVNPTEGENMTTPTRGLVSRISPDRRAQRTASRSGAVIPAEWGHVVTQTADFDPEDDGHLLDWMGGQVAGVAAYGEALVEVYEGLTRDKGADPKAAAAIHDVADAIAHAAEMMAAAKAKFSEHYELPREYAANGGLMTHDGRWVTGEGD